MYGADWRDKAERSLLLAKQLGNIYTGSLYNGLLSLLCDTTIDLNGKKICMFSYGSGCAASMFILNVRSGYEKIRQLSCFKERLAGRVKVSPEEYNQWMSHREQCFGKSNIIPKASIENLDMGTYYLTRIDEKFIRHYAIKGDEQASAGSPSPTLPRNSQAAQRLQ